MDKLTMCQQVEQIYRINENRTDKCLNDSIITDAIHVARNRCYVKEDYFRVLSALNLLNAAIKDKRWKHELSYAFIKGRVAALFNQWISHQIADVWAYYDVMEGAVLFSVDGIIFSFHRIGLSERVRDFIRTKGNKPIVWNGIRLQKIPVELFNLAMAS